ncbi:acyltransferase-domain-containing protein [Rickenella mellea]|uniref:Acyltransferase-domain-containing protein n=1 Tax=Rickenella mellea TaxID=50990 RepID=A0A4Y7QLR8_9AGAM|nr:acyltransferase-domain-containing protein [Rickenella mellea]
MSLSYPDPKGSANLHAIEVPRRPRPSWFQMLLAVLFTIVFNAGCIFINASHFLFLVPLKFIRMSWAAALYEDGIRGTKGAFGTLIVLVSDWFAPTTLRVTFEREGLGSFTKEEIEQILVRDEEGRIIELRLPKKLVLIANHQMYADWWYLWCLTYFMNMHRDVLIVLKKSLKWIPVVGWGMQFFRFIFLARSWASDRLYMTARLSALGRQAQKEDNPFAFIIYPEGTLVSVETRPISKKYAVKLGIPDMEHILLPRATGLHYSLRSLAPRVPSVRLLDITVGYPGIPRGGYGQSYYTLRSIFLDGVPPPAIHLHLRMFDVSTSVPIGDLTTSTGKSLEKTKTGVADPEAVEVDIPEHERAEFETWLRDLWKVKDRRMDEFVSKGSFTAKEAFDIPLKLRSKREIPYAFCYFGPVILGYLWLRLKQGSS